MTQYDGCKINYPFLSNLLSSLPRLHHFTKSGGGQVVKNWVDGFPTMLPRKHLISKRFGVQTGGPGSLERTASQEASQDSLGKKQLPL
jgi:hypothetical protein